MIRDLDFCLIAQTAEAVGVALCGGEDGSTFTGGDLLVGIEAEDGQVAEGADTLLMKFGADGFAGVFNDHKVVARGKGAECEHLGGNAEGVDDEHGAVSRGKDSFDSGWGEVKGDGVDVGEHRCGADVEDGVANRDEGE